MWVAVWALLVIGIAFAVGASSRAAAGARVRQAAARRTAVEDEARRSLPAAYGPGRLPAAVLEGAARVAVSAGSVSAFDLTRQVRVAEGNGRLGITAARAALAELEQRGIVGGENREGRRAALYPADRWVDVLLVLRGRAPLSGE